MAMIPLLPTPSVAQTCDPPAVVAEGSRYFAVTPPDTPDAVAIRVTGAHPDVDCVVGYVQPDGRLLEPAPGQYPETLAVYLPPTGPSGWGTAHVRGRGVTGPPNAVETYTYEVQTDCNPANPGTRLSSPVTVAPWRYGDAGGVSGPDGVVDFVDITMLVDGFLDVWGTPLCCFDDADCTPFGPGSLCNTTWEGCHSPIVAPGRCQGAYPNLDIKSSLTCVPDTIVDFNDIAAIVDVFRNDAEPCWSVCP
jgi:hypothetical protein